VKTFVRFLRQDNCLLNPDTVEVVVRLTEKFGTRNDLIPRYPNYIYRKGLQVFKNYRTLAQEWVESLTNEINLLEPDDELLELYELALRECREDRNIIYTLLSNPEEYDQEWESDFNWILLIPIYELDESEKTPDLKIFSKKLIDSGRIPYCLLDEIDTGLNEKELKEVFQKEHLDKLKASQGKRVEELSEVRRQLEQFITEISEIC
jgi:hypothetical protein